MSARTATLAGRRAAERLMTDACTITRGGAAGTFDEETLVYAAGATSAIYSGACRVKPRDNQDQVVMAGDQPVSLWPYVVSVPMTVTGVEVDDLITVTACHLDPDLVGQVLRVRQVLQGSHLTARRMACEVNAG